MRIKVAALLALLSCLVLPVRLFAQPATTTYQAPTGSVSSSLYITMNFTGGGSAQLNPVVGPNCYYGMTCGFPAGYAGTYMSYTLPDGSKATLPNFHGTFYPSGSGYEVSGQASGMDSRSRYVTVTDVHATMNVTCRSGRGGGCSKVYTGGSLTLYYSAPPPPTPTPSPTPTPGDDS